MPKEYSIKELKRAYRDLTEVSKRLINSNSANVQSNIHSFFSLIESNSVIFDLVSPLLKADLNWHEIEESHPRLIQIPNEKIYRNAYFIQVLEKVKNKQRSIESTAMYFGTRETNINRLISYFMTTLAVSSLNDIINSLGDIIEDLDDREEVSQEQIALIYTEIHANPGTAISIGGDITQIINYYDVKTIQEIKSNIDNEQRLTEVIKNELKDIAEQLSQLNEQKDVNQEEKLKLTKRIKDISGQVGLGIFTNQISDPEFLRSVISLFVS
ncbi:hypothetical protein [Exiguobacterium sp. s78]|uniref:hypothetical protein n=1 Tax=Exiguobacterium sp. s78 TaxID=2751197 RepID=UPI001BEB1464|nr:hypothetical protein [Exiguobacterium sp. s78]